MKQITLDEFEEMAAQSMIDAEITRCRSIHVQFKKWRNIDETKTSYEPFYVCYYTDAGNFSGQDLTPEGAIYKAIQEWVSHHVKKEEAQPAIRYEG